MTSPDSQGTGRYPGRAGAALTVAFCAALWSIAGVVTRQLEYADGFEITFWRSLFCVVFMLVALSLQGRAPDHETHHGSRSGPHHDQRPRPPAGNPITTAITAVIDMGRAGLISGVMWAIMFTCFMLALTRTSTANTLLVLSLAPLLTALLGAVVLGERLGVATWLAIIAAGVGVGWMVHDGVTAEGLAGMAIALAVPFASAINIVTLRRMQARIDLAPAVMTGGLISCLVTLPVAFPFQASGHDLLLLALLGFVQLGLPCMLLMRVAPRLAPHQVALLCLLEVILGPIWAWLGAGEAMSAATIEGGLIVLAALIGNELLSNRRRPAIVQPERVAVRRG